MALLRLRVIADFGLEHLHCLVFAAVLLKQKPAQIGRDQKMIAAMRGRGGLQGVQFAKLLGLQAGVGQSAEVGQEAGHQPRFAGRPCAVRGPLHCREASFDVWPRLIQHSGRLPFDDRFEQIKRAEIDGRELSFAKLLDAGEDFVGGRFAAYFAQHVATQLVQEGVNLLRRTAKQRVGQHL